MKTIALIIKIGDRATVLLLSIRSLIGATGGINPIVERIIYVISKIGLYHNSAANT